MRIVDLRWQRYRIPFRRPVATGHGTLPAREGAIVEVITDAGIIGVGEVAPLPQFGQSLEAALAPLAALAEAIRDHPVADPVSLTAWESAAPPPATRFALETALLDAEYRRLGRPLSAGKPVAVNALVADAEPAAAAASARRAVAAGFRCVKLKVGMLASSGAEVERIAAVRRAIGAETRLRLDANEAWSLEQACDVLNAAAPYDVEYCEQPLPAADLEGMRDLRRRAPVRIAADEAATDAESARRVVEREAADLLVLKLPLVGGRQAAWEIRASLSGRVGFVLTSALEAGVGVAAALHCASALLPDGHACGLATLDLLEDDLIREPPRIERGLMYPPTDPGLGVELDRDALARYAV